MMHNNSNVQDVVLIGGGIAGLATALALHRLGLKSLVLESSDELRSAGSAIAVWNNAWKALEVLDVADGLRDKFQRVSGVEFFTDNDDLLASLNFKDAGRDVEVRAVKRMDLVEALREPLPEGIIMFGARVSSIHKVKGGHTEVECEDGKKIHTKVLVGCDGIGSVVAKWLGLKKAKHAGYTAIRGLAKLPYEHKLKPMLQQVVGKGVRMGTIPVDAKSAFWFLVFNPKGKKVYKPELIREEALMQVQGWSNPITSEIIKHTPVEILTRRDIADRWTWPMWTNPNLYQGGVTIAGDAMHPMTPNLGQGGCCALEDAVVLARNLGNALLMSKEQGLDGTSEMEGIETALKKYTQERWPRTLGITIRSYVVGAVLQTENGLLCSIRNALLPKMMSVEGLTAHTFFDCGSLQNVA